MMVQLLCKCQANFQLARKAKTVSWFMNGYYVLNLENKMWQQCSSLFFTHPVCEIFNMRSRDITDWKYKTSSVVVVRSSYLALIKFLIILKYINVWAFLNHVECRFLVFNLIKYLCWSLKKIHKYELKL